MFLLQTSNKLQWSPQEGSAQTLKSAVKHDCKEIWRSGGETNKNLFNYHCIELKEVIKLEK